VSWEITEDSPTIIFKRFYEPLNIFIEIKQELEGTDLLFEAHAYNSENELCAMVYAHTFHDSLDRVLGAVREGRPLIQY